MSSTGERVEWGVQWPDDPDGLVRITGPHGDYTDFDSANADVKRRPELGGTVVSRLVGAWIPDPDGTAYGDPGSTRSSTGAVVTQQPGLVSTPLKVSLGTWKQEQGQRVLVPTKGREDLGYRLGLEQRGDKRVVGLLNANYPDRMGFMAYYLDEHFVPAEVISRAREHHQGRFFFDIGGNGSPMWSTADDLEAAFERLGLLDAKAPTTV